MNDEQILRKLAEIEGYTVHELGFCPHASPNGDVMERGAWGLYVDDPVVRNKYMLFNPLDNAEQVLVLVEKYRLEICPAWESLRSGELGWKWDVTNIGQVYVNDPDLKRAICLAIIGSKAVEKAA